MKDRGMEKKECVSPQQPDGISSIHSWNVRNAGQSDLTEREGGEDRQFRKGKKRRSDIRESVAQLRSWGLNSACHCGHKAIELLFVEGVVCL